jgi:hypothetical protein
MSGVADGYTLYGNPSQKLRLSLAVFRDLQKAFACTTNSCLPYGQERNSALDPSAQTPRLPEIRHPRVGVAEVSMLLVTAFAGEYPLVF